MRNRLTAIMLIVALGAAVVQLPVAVAQPVTRHSCCHKQTLGDAAPGAMSPMSMPAAPVHRCCVAKAPLKVPSLPTKGADLSDFQIRSTISIVASHLQTNLSECQAPGGAIRSPISLSAVLRV